MQAPAPRSMDADSFLGWMITLRKGERYELDAGLVVAMQAERAGQTEAKFAVTLAFKRAIADGGLACQAFVDGLAVRMPNDTVYEPDSLVRCGDRLDADRYVIDDPVIVVEVTSPSSSRIDAEAKLVEYFDLPSVRHYLIVSLAQRCVIHHRRDDDGRIQTTIRRQGELTLDPPGLTVDVEALFG